MGVMAAVATVGVTMEELEAVASNHLVARGTGGVYREVVLVVVAGVLPAAAVKGEGGDSSHRS